MDKDKEGQPLVNYNFCLRVEGVHDLPCKSIHGFEDEYEYEYIREGGLNDYVHLRRKPSSKPKTFQVERYVGMEENDPLAIGTVMKMPVILFVSRHAQEFEMVKRTYIFVGCVVTGKSYGELDASSSGLLLETTTISYRHLMCVDNQVDKEKPAWSGKAGDKGYARNVSEYGYTKKEDAGQKKWLSLEEVRKLK